MNKLFIPIALFFFSTQAQEEPISISKTNEDIILDGKLNESFWRESKKFTDFKQIYPELSKTATEVTEAYLSYNDEYLFFGAVMKFKDVSQIFARVMERDVNLLTDDFVEIHLDTYNDRTNSLVFKTNPLATRFDFENNRNGQDLNNSWNTFWDVATSRTNDGWVAEFRIPFTSLRFEKANINLMRFKVVAKYKENNELVIFPLNNTQITGALFDYSNSQLIQFNNLPLNMVTYVTPYAKGGVLKQSVLNDTGTSYKYKTDILERKKYFNNEALDKISSNIGVDVKWKPNANNTLDFTLNTDFAQIESDDRIINVSRFSIALPEKRLFFLENADLFNSNMFEHRLFQSRRIGIFQGSEVPLVGGLRYVGNFKRWQIGAMSLQTGQNDFFDLPSYNNTVVRAKLRVGEKGSYIGFVNTSKLADGDYNYLLATDGSLRLTDNFLMDFVLGSTFDKFRGNLKPVYGLALTNFRTNGFGFQYRFRDYTENFNPELGFVSQPNTKSLTTNNGFRKTYTDHNFLQSLSYGHYLRKNWISSTNEPGYFQTNMYLRLGNKKGYFLEVFAPIYKEDYIYEDWSFAENISIPTGNYQMWQVEPSFNNGRSHQYQFEISSIVGTFYGGNQLSFSTELNYDISKNIKVQFGANYNRFTFPEDYSSNGLTNVELNRYFSRIKLAFSSKSFLNLYAQYTNNSENLGFNLRYRYQPTEGTDLYIVYNHNINTDREAMMPTLNTTQNQSIIVKFSKTFIL